MAEQKLTKPMNERVTDHISQIKWIMDNCEGKIITEAENPGLWRVVKNTIKAMPGLEDLEEQCAQDYQIIRNICKRTDINIKEAPNFSEHLINDRNKLVAAWFKGYVADCFVLFAVFLEKHPEYVEEGQTFPFDLPI